ncbi:MAG TPA: hypothetical protein PKY88_13175 [Anaerohalosphaeraceae bacterium]|nr:hypothetical protein [Anaerohalosphaeraceae bacterium]
MALNGMLKLTAAASDSKDLPMLKAQASLNWSYIQMLLSADAMTPLTGTLEAQNSLQLVLDDGSLLDQFGEPAAYETLAAVIVRNSGTETAAAIQLKGTLAALGGSQNGILIPPGGAAFLAFGAGAAVGTNETIVIENADTEKDAACEVILFGKRN